MSLRQQVSAVKGSAAELLAASESQRHQVLTALAELLRTHQHEIVAQNQRDLAAGTTLSPALLNRLTLTPAGIEAMARGVEAIAQGPAVVGVITEGRRRADGLVIEKERIPLGVIAMVFESRPNVVIDGAALAIKSGNALILKGGKEAAHSNRYLAQLVHRAMQGLLPRESLLLLETREAVDEILRMDEFIDLMVPRGGEALIRHVKAHATMPVVAHDRGLCHMYLHEDAPWEMARDIVLNAKTQRPGVCNALETLLVHRAWPHTVRLIDELRAKEVQLKGCSAASALHSAVERASEEDWNTEWLALTLNLKIVPTAAEALAHIRRYGSHHTEGLVTQDGALIAQFKASIDASCLAINASTRFNDGGELGLGAELGISTSKLHAYGPMGVQEMTTTRFVVTGQGHTRK